MSEQDPLPGDLNQLRREKRWTPLTPEEADAELADTPDEPLGEDLIDTLVRSANLGDILPMTLRAADPWVAEDEIADHDRHALLLNRAPDEGGEGPAEKPEEPSDQDASGDKEDELPNDASPHEPGN